jgi:hypothetical protein
LAGLAIDSVGWGGGFALPAVLGLLVTGAGAAVLRRHTAAGRTSDPAPAAVG